VVNMTGFCAASPNPRMRRIGLQPVARRTQQKQNRPAHTITHHAQRRKQSRGAGGGGHVVSAHVMLRYPGGIVCPTDSVSWSVSVPPRYPRRHSHAPSSLARAALITTMAAAPSLILDELAAVTVPSFWNAGRSDRSLSACCIALEAQQRRRRRSRWRRRRR
jgi:hypothetical protein